MVGFAMFQAHSRGRLCPIPKTSNILTEAREPIMNGDRQSMEIGRNDAHLSLLGAFPKVAVMSASFSCYRG